MKRVAIKENCLDTTLLDRVSEQTAISLGYYIIEVEDSLVTRSETDCKIQDFDYADNKFIFNKDKYNNRINAINLKEEQEQLIDWFEEYDNQVKQYQRCVRLGIEYDKDIVELDNQAKINQERIREIKNILKV